MLDWMVQTGRGLFLQGSLGGPRWGRGPRLGRGPLLGRGPRLDSGPGLAGGQLWGLEALWDRVGGCGARRPWGGGPRH